MTTRHPANARRPSPNTASEEARLGYWKAWVIAAVVPIGLCAMRLNLDLWGDEAYTIGHFVSQPWFEIATDYSAPNNHIFYSLVLRPVCLLSSADFFLRLPSFLFAVGTFIFVFRLVDRWADIRSAGISVLVLGLTQMFLVHAVQIRGYGLSMLLAAWLGDLALPVGHHRRWRRSVAIVLVGAAFLYTIPTNGLFFGAIACGAVAKCALVERRLSALIGEAVVWLVSGTVGILLYVPVWQQLREMAAHQPGVPLLQVWHLACATYWAALRDWWPILLPAAIGAGLLLRDRSADKAREVAAFAVLIACVLVLPFVLAGLLRVAPFARNFCPMLPFLAMALGCTLLRAADGAGRWVSARWSDAAGVGVAVLLLFAVAMPPILTYPHRLAEIRRREPRIQDGYFNYYAAAFEPSRVVEYLKSIVDRHESYTLVMADGDHHCLVYYCQRFRLPLDKVSGDDSAQEVAVYMIAPEKPDYESVSARSRIPVTVLRRFPVVKRFGYYQVYALMAVRPANLPTQPGGLSMGPEPSKELASDRP